MTRAEQAKNFSAIISRQLKKGKKAKAVANFLRLRYLWKKDGNLQIDTAYAEALSDIRMMVKR